MSYAVGFHIIKDVESVEDAVNKINNFFKTLNKEEYVENFMNYLSSLFLDEKITKLDFFDKKIQNLLKTFIKEISRFKFVYWSDHKILGLVSLNYSWKYSNIDFIRYIEFQNSTDNDYDLDTWKNISPGIDKIVNTYKDMSNDDLMKKFEEVYKSPYTASDVNLEYYRRTFIYDDIEKELDVTNYIYNKKSNKMVLLNMFYDYSYDHDLARIAFNKAKEYLTSEFPRIFKE